MAPTEKTLAERLRRRDEAAFHELASRHEHAIHRFVSCMVGDPALAGARLHGPVTNRDQLRRILLHPDFVAGDLHTGFLDEHPCTEPFGEPPLAAAAAALALQARHRADATTWVVVGTMGAGDEEALAAAARSDAAYVGLVASRKKARYLIDYVRASGVPEERLTRVKYPAGLDLGGMGAAEIALSVLAEIVQRRYGKSTPLAAGASANDLALGDPTQAALWPNLARASSETTEPAPTSAAAPVPPSTPVALGRGRGADARPTAFPIDPVCGMPVEPATARHTLVEGDRTIYFCCPHCKATYVRRQAESTA